MGGKNSKGKKNKKNKGKQKADAPNTSGPAEDLSDSSDDDVIYTKTGGKVCAQDFDMLKVIGKGSFGKVMQVRKKDTGQVMALKILKKSMLIERNQVEHTMSERQIMHKISHPFIVNLLYAFQTPEKLYLVMEYVNGGELFFHLKNEGRFSEERVKLYVAELSCALGHLHSFDIVYRDLKPENILLDHEGHIKITDFGLSKQFESPNETTETFCGTPEYLAPEILQGKGHGKGVDWWSLGTLMYEMLTGLPPFYSQNVNVMYQKILGGTLTFPDIISADAREVLEGMLNRDPDARLGSGPSGFEDVKKQVFFADLDWDRVLTRAYEPEFVPKVVGDDDTSQVDPVFTAEPVVDTPVQSSDIAAASDANAFGGFTFVGGDDSVLKS
ncbi:AGC protein kinase [Thecamonas trahens ATCC 50062]|uniref:non-specific serine/threonine protein kinase n=1 Tax=Thecamonas trahens ATCC 50062 TaxID=461836 RepID=A0A0L0DIF4_THETB|nr:AGC protein kinase [Thecamonas trahens ATCC 50062]KNC52144.1 AGC protein kinase [Thecamonas trahens ATCC 50062]|eukprot:XP_013762147.1 AGC protein kinase [Thecamonas trahens ATCC 50062]